MAVPPGLKTQEIKVQLKSWEIPTTWHSVMEAIATEEGAQALIPLYNENKELMGRNKKAASMEEILSRVFDGYLTVELALPEEEEAIA